MSLNYYFFIFYIFLNYLIILRPVGLQLMVPTFTWYYGLFYHHIHFSIQ